MASDEGVEDMSSVVECLVNMFGGVINRDAIFTVVESCGGDLNLSADVIMNITSDTSQEDTENNKINTDDEAAGSVPQNAPLNPMPSSNNSMDVSCTKNMQPQPTTSSTNQQPFNSYAMQAAQQPATSNQMQIPPGFQGSESKSRTVPSNSFILPWTDQMKRIVEYHNEGSRVLIMMRGAPGCGKTYMARKLVEILLGSNIVNFKTFICSTDDFFCHRGNYYFNKQNLSDAHAWNQKRVRLAMQQGLSPIIVDNTNIEVWEMEFYVRNGVENGYYLEVVEPNTPWAKKPNQLAKKNVHGVPIQSIKRMVENYIDGITGDSLLEYFKLKYPSEKKPPVLRTMPAFRPETSIKGNSKIYSTNNADTPNKLTSSQTVPITEVKKDEESKRHSPIVVNALPTQNMHENTGPVLHIKQQVSLNLSEPEVVDKTVTGISKIVETPTNSENIAANNSNQYLELQKQLEEIEKVEQEWENGESWEEGQQEAAASIDKKIITSPKPPRTVSPTPESNSDGNLIEVVNNCQDWSQISLFMPPWTDQIPQSIDFVNPVVDKISNSTCMELGDFDYSRNSHKILSTSPRDINQFHIPFNRERIPDIRMLDKSTTTNEPWVTEKYRCKNEESHFIAFRKMFKDISRTALRDIFDQCMGDVNWAVEIVLDGVAANQFKTVDEEDLNDEDTDDQELCTCLSYYNIVPDTSTQSEVAPQQEEMIVTTEATIVAKKSSKRDVKTSDASLQLKRQIEQNVSIGDQHYSKHCLNLKKWRHGHSLPDEEVVQDENQPSTSQGLQSNNRALACINISAEDQNSDDEESTVSEEPEKTINITLGKEFITVLDTLFGRADMVYPDNLSPRVNMPVSLLNEINALWMESLMHQLDEQERQCAKMMKEDEDLARVLAMKEAEMSTVGYKQPEVLDFKEILDMDYALSLYQKDVAEWKNKEPKDLAAKLTREKLYNLFPEVEKSLLDELLMAHENNFKNTVEVLLVSTGKASVLQEKDGVNTFVTQKEMERQQKVLEEERKALSEVEWPLLPTGEVPDMEVVNNHRDNAERHLKRRDQNIQKARDYLRRGMVSVGNYYRELAEGHRMKYEYANSLAAASLMQYHAANCPDNATLDLHYLRVGEAKESLDLFIDTHIQKLKTTQSQGPRVLTLFFITGRGLHSNGRPRIKPAVKKRLMERGLFCSEVNPGLLSTKVCADDRLTHQVA